MTQLAIVPMMFLLTAASLNAGQGQSGGPVEGNRTINWNARAQWGPRERSASPNRLREPFRIFDNVTTSECTRSARTW